MAIYTTQEQISVRQKAEACGCVLCFQHRKARQQILKTHKGEGTQCWAPPPFALHTPGWPGNTSGSPGKSWTKWLGRGKSGFPCLGCCPRDPKSDKRKKMDGWTNLASLFSNCWPGNTSGSPGKSWTKWLGRGKSGFPCLGCCPRDPKSDKRKKMDGWTNLASLFSNCWPGNTSGSPGKSWTKWLGRGKSGFPCLGCCPRDPKSDKRKKMDGWTNLASLFSNCASLFTNLVSSFTNLASLFASFLVY
ncbi:uncharacterized protein LOC133645081 isoform X3 [Entelurus aequoreus]|uniref:uncharacterized protein LOC133645081 isoform X3 n=1 Tax=Entelurus aequoreus TaxID=161455 RepID=UPI002B1D440F|nr:uncharacterized protein LOC133645081 isoform X3 [Entelurus aequoreus]